MADFIKQIDMFDFKENIHYDFLFHLNKLYSEIKPEEEYEFLDSLFYVFRNSVHNISSNHNINKILGLIKFVEQHNINDLILKNDDIICFSFPLRNQLYNNSEPYFSKDFLTLYNIFFDKDNIFVKNNHNTYGWHQTINEIKEFLNIGLSRFSTLFNNSFFSNLIILDYFYYEHNEWLAKFKNVPELSNIRKLFSIENF